MGLQKCPTCGEEHAATMDCLEALGVDPTTLYLEDRERRLQRLFDQGADYDPEGHFISLDGRLYDEDGERL